MIQKLLKFVIRWIATAPMLFCHTKKVAAKAVLEKQAVLTLSKTDPAMRQNDCDIKE